MNPCEFCNKENCQCDLDQNNPVDLTKEEWQDIYSDPDYDLDNDHSMDY